ncbi:phosphotransferase [Brachybacterium sp. SGAir0954]|uniref:phosphotransferase n=1 Tax=Brachybacterium sp. SGAir0954 TaxID=2571029 RepID=UPI001F0D9F25|nr:phosphotransferase [Brachybacterium sp. SGAir0954]
MRLAAELQAELDRECNWLLFVDGDEVTGIIDWSEAAPGDPMMDLAVLTLGHEERLEDLLAGYDGDGREPADRTAIRAWWSLRSLTAAR